MNHFGTDGIRGMADIFTKEYLNKIIKAALMVKPRAKFVIGRDTRESGEKIEEGLTSAILKYGGKAIIAGMTATPILAFLTKELSCDFGIMISASHNPPEYNGVKFFDRAAEKISDEIESKIDYNIDNLADLPIYNCQNEKEYYYGDKDYVNYLIQTLKPNIKDMKICLDCSNGSASAVAPELFSMLGAKVHVFNKETTGKNINKGCGATQPHFIARATQESNCDIGFAYDGDGDRLIAYSKGKVFNGDHIMYMHGLIMKKYGELKKNTIVSTVMSNMGMEIACKNAGIELVRTNVGDKFVYRNMVDNGYNVGGEESGHLIFRDYMNTSDGILASLLTAILANQYSLIELNDIKEYPKAVDFYKCMGDESKRFYQDNELQDYLNDLRFSGRAVVRPSGTEPIIRILVEAEDKTLAEDKAKEIKSVITRRLHK